MVVPITLCNTDTNAFPFTVDSVRQSSVHSQWHILGPKMICPSTAVLTLVPLLKQSKQICLSRQLLEEAAVGPSGSRVPIVCELDEGSVMREPHLLLSLSFQSDWPYVHHHSHCVGVETDSNIRPSAWAMWFARLSASSRPVCLSYSLPPGPPGL